MAFYGGFLCFVCRSFSHRHRDISLDIVGISLDIVGYISLDIVRYRWISLDIVRYRWISSGYRYISFDIVGYRWISLGIVQTISDDI